jgi:Ras-related C3 botulinum toxin substrate 1
MRHIKIVVVGDIGRDKTLLLRAYTTNAFPGEYVPTVMDNYWANIVVEDQQINLQLWDTAEQEDYVKLRPLSYPQTDVFVICFSLVQPQSLANVQLVWVPEISKHCPGVPYVLVGMHPEQRNQFDTHADEYRSKGWEPVPTSHGEAMMRRIGAQCYIECSPRMSYNVREVFDRAVQVVLHQPQDCPAGAPAPAPAAAPDPPPPPPPVESGGGGCCEVA